MATEKWISGSGQGLTWGSAAGSEVNSLANGNAVLSTVSITNGTALDIFADVSVICSCGIATAAPTYLGVYVYPLAEDGSTYGDGRFGSATTGPPPSNYWTGNIMVSTASSFVNGTLRGIILPPGTFSFVFYNQAGATLATSVVIKYRTYNRSVA